jgi:hypothetical protein
MEWLKISEFNGDPNLPILVKGVFKGPNPLALSIAVCIYDSEFEYYVIEADAGGFYEVVKPTHFAVITDPIEVH